MKKTFSQTGRTLLETLVVVVIIAVILISVVLLYVSVRDRAQARTMSQMIMALVKERQHLNLDETKTHSRKIKGLYDIDFTLTTPLPSEPEGKYFWIGMEVDDEGLCQELIESGSIQYQMLKINNEKDGECPGNIVFYFLKNPHSKGSSSSGESQTPECPFNAICENGGYIPTGCVSGYFLQDTSCVRCPQNSIDCDGESFECLDGFYKNGNECESCGAHVATCDSTGKAISCLDDYYGENCENAPLACQNDGTWNSTTHVCDCISAAYSGDSCENFNSCYGVDCGSHGTCSNGTCVCSDNYYGENCENAPLACQNGGSWNTTTHQCDCVTGYTGVLCSEKESGTCTSYLDCKEGEYCQFSPFDSEIEPTSGTCLSVSDCGMYDIDIGDGKKYTASNYSGSCSPDWWTAKDVCASLNMHMPSLSEVGCEDYKDDVCPTSGTVYGALRVKGLKSAFWTRDMWNNTVAYAISPLDNVDWWSRATNRNILCIENGDTSGEGGTVDPCAGFEPTICTTACTNNNGTAVYTYAEEGTTCDSYLNSTSACDGQGNCNDCSVLWAGSTSAFACSYFNVDVSLETNITGCCCLKGAEWDGAHCITQGHTGGLIN